MNEPIRIAHIIGKWLGGGVEAVVMNYYRHIDRNKIQFDFICDNDSTNIPYKEIEKLGGKVILVPPYQKIFEYQKALKKVLKEGNYKIVHSHINTLSVFPLRIAKKVGIPVRIAHSHSTTNKKEWKKNLLKQILRPFSKVYATDYFACSEYAGRWLFGNKTFDKGKVFILNNAIDLDKFKYDENVRKEMRKELNISDDTLVIGHIGRFVEQKNHRFLIDIFNEIHKQNENSILLLIGQGPLMEEIKQKVNLLNLTNSVKFLGQRNDANKLYQAMDVFVLPSLYEGLPVVGVEAQAAGLLCIFSNDMTKETKILDSTVFMLLNDCVSAWCNNILNLFNTYKRKDTKKQIEEHSFNIKDEATALYKKYFSYINCNQKYLSMSQIKTIELSILKEISKICSKNNINYSLGYGTLIGAIRHKGFIPWDDDIDIIMLREDYNRFVNIIKNNPKYDVVDENSDNFYYPYLKITDKKTITKEYGNKMQTGIWVDVFPIDNLPNNIIKQKIYLKLCKYLRALILSSITDFSTTNDKKRFIKKIGFVISKIVGLKNLKKFYSNLVTKYSHENTVYVSCLSSPYIGKETFNRNYFENTEKKVFENDQYECIIHYSEYLTQIYGDYMIIPKKNERKSHQIIAWYK